MALMYLDMANPVYSASLAARFLPAQHESEKLGEPCWRTDIIPTDNSRSHHGSKPADIDCADRMLISAQVQRAIQRQRSGQGPPGPASAQPRSCHAVYPVAGAGNRIAGRS